MPADTVVPLRTPAALNVKPTGSVPVATLQVGTGVPVAAKLKLYAALTVPAGGAPLVITGPRPTPVAETVADGLFEAGEVLTVSAVPKAPIEGGVAVTSMVQVAPGATTPLTVQVPVPATLKPGPIAKAVVVNAIGEVFVKVAVSGVEVTPKTWLPNASGLGASVAEGVKPVPLNATASGLVAALLRIFSCAVRDPAPVGVKPTDI